MPQGYHEILKEKVNRYRGTFIELQTLYSFIEEENKELRLAANDPDGYARFARSVFQLMEEGLLAALKTSPTNTGREPALPLKYRKLPPATDYESIKREIRKLSLPLKIDYYLNNPGEYITDRAYIAIIDRFFKSGPAPLASINERSYQLFRDEKFLRGGRNADSRGEKILKNLGLTYEALNCYLTYEPFFHINKDNALAGERKNVLIIENMDTFWSFERLLSAGNKLNICVLVYGEGKKILSSFRFCEVIGLTEKDCYYYFGDMDPEGINILGQLASAYPEHSITPFLKGYELMLQLAVLNDLAGFKEGQRLDKRYADLFLQMFSAGKQEKIREIIEKGLYIPQEILSLSILREYFGGAAHGQH